MARTDVKKSKEAVWIKCSLEGFDDEEHLIVPGTRENLQYVSDKSMVNEFRNGQMTRESDNNVFTVQWLKRHWVGWRGVGIVHESGDIEDPAECTIDNRLIVANARGQAFLLWLQEMSRQLAAKAQQDRDAQQEAFRQPDQIPVGQTEPSV